MKESRHQAMMPVNILCDILYKYIKYLRYLQIK